MSETNNKKFFFVKETTESMELNSKKGDNYMSIIKVVFYPEEITKSSWNVPLACNDTIFNTNNIKNKIYRADSRSVIENDCIEKSSTYTLSHNFINYNVNPQYPLGKTELDDKKEYYYKKITPLQKINTNLIKTIILKVIVDNRYDKQFISIKEANKRKKNDFPLRMDEIKKIPYERIYDDFFFINRILPYDQY